LIEILGSLVERPLIKVEFDRKYPSLVALVDEELNTVKKIYDKHIAMITDFGKMPVHTNMAKVSGYIKWSRELKDRITYAVTELRKLEHP